jgi:hypothetical protein
MKFFSAIVLASIFSAQILAAQFSQIGKLSSPAAQKLAQAGLSIVNNQDVFGDNGKVVALTFTKKSTENNMATTKQLSFKNGANSDDFQKDFKRTNVKEICDFAFNAIENGESENEAAFKAARINLTAALNAVKADKTLEIYGNQHADEDGSWNILFVFDTITNQILMLKIGYSGT